MDQEREVDLNFDAFQQMLPDVMASHHGQFALLRHQRVIDYFATLRIALTEGKTRFSDDLFSVQEVTDRPADLGFFSHAVDPRIA